MEAIKGRLSSLISSSLDNQRAIFSDFPEPVMIALGKIIGDIIEGKSKGKATFAVAECIEQSGYYGGNCNVIPSKVKGSCTPLLIVSCYDSDSFEYRILEGLDHAARSCYGICRNIYFLSTQWDSKIENKLAGYIESVRNNGLTINFIYISEKGLALMPS